MDELKQKKSSQNTKENWNIKEHLLPIILLSITMPLTIFVFGPITIYNSNSAEFKFVLGDFFYWNILMAIGAIILIAGILLITKGWLYYTTYAIIFAFTFSFFIQGNYLNFGVNSLGGDNETSMGLTVVLNTLIWLLMFSIIIFCILKFIKKHREIIKTVITVILVTIIGVQCVSVTIIGINGNTFVSHKDRVEENIKEDRKFLTYKNLNELSENKNIIYFVVDRFDWRFCEKGLEQNPEMFDELDGFTLYDDGMSLYPRTFPSVAYMLSGIENDWSMDRHDYFDYAYKNSAFLKTLKANNYRVNLFTDIFYAYENAQSMAEYIANATNVSTYSVNRTASLAWKMTRLSFYRFLPMFAKNLIGLSTGSFAENVKFTDVDYYTVDMRDLYNRINSEEFKLFKDKNNFSFIHFTGTHTPFDYDDNFNPVKNNKDVQSALRQSFKIINSYIKKMKALGVYDNATIVITGDHCKVTDNHKEPNSSQTIPIFFKESKSHEGKMKRTSAPVCQENIVPAILESEGISTDGFKKSLLQIHEGDNITRKYYFQRMNNKNGKLYHDQIEYEVNGLARDFNNWKVTKRWFIGKNIYD